ncbi:class I SAM-dependent methyltransferase [Thermodesulfobacteriota bacterium]
MVKIETVCRTLGPVIQKMDNHQYRRTNKAYPKDYLKNFNLNSVEWLRYLKIFDTIRNTNPLSVNRAPRVLEIGTNLGIFTSAYRNIFPDHQLYSLDHPVMAREAANCLFPELRKQGVHMAVSDIQKPLPFADHCFDIVLFLAVIEHLPNSPRLQLNEIHRVLKPDGFLFLDTPNLGAFERKYNMLLHGKGPYFELNHFFFSESPFSGHHREYNLNDLKQMLEWSHFKVTETSYFDCALRRCSNVKSLLAKIACRKIARLRHAIALVAQPI